MSDERDPLYWAQLNSEGGGEETPDFGIAGVQAPTPAVVEPEQDPLLNAKWNTAQGTNWQEKINEQISFKHRLEQDDPTGKNADRMRAAIFFSDHYNIAPDFAYNNLPILIESFMGEKMEPVPFLKAAKNAFKAGWVQNQIFDIQYKRATGQGVGRPVNVGSALEGEKIQDLTHLEEQLRYLESIMPPPDQTRRNVFGNMVLWAVGNLPLMLSSALEGAKWGMVSASGVAAANLIWAAPVAATGLGAPVGAAAYFGTTAAAFATGSIVGANVDLDKKMVGMVYDMLDKMRDENGNRISQDVKSRVALVVGPVIGLLEGMQIGKMVSGMSPALAKIFGDSTGFVLRDTILKSIGNKTLRAFAHTGIDIFTEGVEEGSQQLVQMVANNIAMDFENRARGAGFALSDVKTVVKSVLENAAVGAAASVPLIGIGAIAKPLKRNVFHVVTEEEYAEIQKQKTLKELDELDLEIKQSRGSAISRSVVKDQAIQPRTPPMESVPAPAPQIESIPDGAGKTPVVTSAQIVTPDGPTVGQVVERIIKEEKAWESTPEEWARIQQARNLSDAAEVGISPFKEIFTEEFAPLRYSLQQAAPHFTAEEVDFVASMLDVVAKAQGIPTQDMTDTLFAKGIFYSQEEIAQLPAEILQEKEAELRARGVEGAEFQKEMLGTRAKVSAMKGVTAFMEDGKALVALMKTADVGTALHEMFHVFRKWLPAPMLEKAAKWAGAVVDENGNWDEAGEEMFANTGVEYVRQGYMPPTAPADVRSIFQRLAEWIEHLYKSIRGRIQLSDEMIETFDDIFSKRGSLMVGEKLLLRPNPMPVEETRLLYEIDGRDLGQNDPSLVEDWLRQSDYQAQFRRQYLDENGQPIAKKDAAGNTIYLSSRTTPVSGQNLRLGQWLIDDGAKGLYGHEIAQLRELDPNVLLLSEEDWTDPSEANILDKRSDFERYFGWMAQGLTPPPIVVVETDRGSLRVTDGHRRVAAAKAWMQSQKLPPMEDLSSPDVPPENKWVQSLEWPRYKPLPPGQPLIKRQVLLNDSRQEVADWGSPADNAPYQTVSRQYRTARRKMSEEGKGRVRRGRLERRLNEVPLFADELRQRELTEREGYYQGQPQETEYEPKGLLAWVWPSMDHPKGLIDPSTGTVMRVGMTYEGVKGKDWIDPTKRGFLFEVDPVKQKKAIKLAMEHFGLTEDPREAGYILPNGKMLDFSGRHLLDEYNKMSGQLKKPFEITDDDFAGDRTVDHGAIPDEIVGVTGSAAEKRTAFLRTTGAVRMDFKARIFDAMGTPTEKQLQQMNDVAASWPTAYFEMENEKGQSVGFKEVRDPSISSIRSFFDSSEYRKIKSFLYQTDPAIVEKINKEAIDVFGTTDNPATGGWILTTGQMVDMSNRWGDNNVVPDAMPRGRMVHRAIGVLKSIGPLESVLKMQTQAGAIRMEWSPTFSAIESSEIPTEQQFAQIEKVMRGMKSLTLEMVDSKTGRPLAFKEFIYPTGQNIRDFYEASKFYSPKYLFDTDPWLLRSAEVVRTKVQGSGMPGKQVKGILAANGVTADEMHWISLDDYIEDDKKYTSKDLLEFIGKNAIRIDENLYGAREAPPMQKPKLIGSRARYGEETYRSPGGANYRELTITLKQVSERREQAQYNSDHFALEGMIGWMRFQDYETEELGKTLLVDEFQSEWAEKAKAQGISDRSTLAKAERETREHIANLENRAMEIDPELKRLYGAHRIAEVELEKQEAAMWKRREDIPGDTDEDTFYYEAAKRVNELADSITSLRGELFAIEDSLAQLRQGIRFSEDSLIPPAPFIAGRRWGIQVKVDGQVSPEEWTNDKGQTQRFTSPEEAEKFIKKAGIKDAGVMDMGYIETTTGWAGLEFKRALRWAVEHGYDTLAWTEGATQNKRWGLSNLISEIEWEEHPDASFSIRMNNKDGDVVFHRTEMPKEDLVGIIGQNKIDQIEFWTKQGEVRGTIEGEDLEMGGEFMTLLYDKIVVNFAEKWVKKWGGEVGKGKLDISSYVERVPQTVWTVKITDAMRESVKEGVFQQFLMATDEHEEKVVAAVLRGDPVPDEVLASYAEKDWAKTEIAAREAFIEQIRLGQFRSAQELASFQDSMTPDGEASKNYAYWMMLWGKAGGDVETGEGDFTAVTPAEANKAFIKSVNTEEKMAAFLMNMERLRHKDSLSKKGSKSPFYGLPKGIFLAYLDAKKRADTMNGGMSTDAFVVALKVMKADPESYRMIDAEMGNEDAQRQLQAEEAMEPAEQTRLRRENARLRAQLKVFRLADEERAVITTGGKELWEMTKAEWAARGIELKGYAKKRYLQGQEGRIREALMKGEEVPNYVLAEWPSLQKLAGQIAVEKAEKPKVAKAPPKPQGLPAEVEKYARDAGVDPATIRIASQEERKELSSRYGPANAIDVGEGFLSPQRAGSIFVDDETGKIVAYIPPKQVAPGVAKAPPQPEKIIVATSESVIGVEDVPDPELEFDEEEAVAIQPTLELADRQVLDLDFERQKIVAAVRAEYEAIKKGYEERIASMKEDAVIDKRWTTEIHRQEKRLAYLEKAAAIAALRERMAQKLEKERQRRESDKKLWDQERAQRQEKERVKGMLKVIQGIGRRVWKMRSEVQAPLHSTFDAVQNILAGRNAEVDLTQLRNVLAEEGMEFPESFLDELDKMNKTAMGMFSFEQIDILTKALLHWVQYNHELENIRIGNEAIRAEEVIQSALGEMKSEKEVKDSLQKLDPTRFEKFMQKGGDIFQDLLGLGQIQYEVITELLSGPNSVMHNLFFKQIEEGRKVELEHKFRYMDYFEAEVADIGLKDLHSWLGEKIIIQNGPKSLELSRSKILSLYMHSLSADNRASILKKGVGSRTDPRWRVRPMKITEDLLNEVQLMVQSDPKAVKFTEVLQTLMKMTGDDISFVYEQRYGYPMPRPENYWHKDTMPSGRATTVEEQKALDQVRRKSLTPGVPKGRTKMRKGAEIALYLNDVEYDLMEAINYAAMYRGLEIPVYQSMKLLRNEQFTQSLAARYGEKWQRYIENAIRDIVGEHQAMSGFERIMARSRNVLQVAFLGNNPFSMLKILLGFANASAYVRTDYLMRGIADTILHPKAVDSFNRTMSPLFRDRIEEGFTRDIAEMSKIRQAGKLAHSRYTLQRVGLAGIRWADRIAINWAMRGAFIQAMSELSSGEIGPELQAAIGDSIAGRNTAELPIEYRFDLAMRFADYVQTRTQDQHLPEYRSQLSRSSAMGGMAKFFTMFGSNTNTNLNVMVRAANEFKRGTRKGVKLAKVTLVMMVAVPLAEALVTHMRDELMGRYGDDEEKWRKVLGNYAQNLTSMSFFLRDITQAVVQKMRTGRMQQFTIAPISVMNEFLNMVSAVMDMVTRQDSPNYDEIVNRGLNRMADFVIMMSQLPLLMPKRYIEQLVEKANR